MSLHDTYEQFSVRWIVADRTRYYGTCPMIGPFEVYVAWIGYHLIDFCAIFGLIRKGK